MTLSANARGISPVPAINVQAVGLGEMISGDVRTGITAVKLFVRKKYPLEQISESHALPTEIDGLPVDVEEIGDLRPLAAMPNPRSQIRPAQPGCSVGFRFPSGSEIMAGTFGAVVRDSGGKQYVLSNNHVLADESQLSVGALIYQAGLLDEPGGASAQVIAKLSRFSNFKAAPLKIDAAIAEAIGPGVLSPQILYIGAVNGTEPAAVDMVVHKFGRTTSYTVGHVTSIATDVTVGYETGNYTFFDQIIVEGLSGQPFSAAGDSGSLIVNRQTGNAVGLLFAGSAAYTIANHIEDVLTGMNVSLV
ncbi:MAG: hypothetical protein ABSA49_08240 [Rhizomicrobium sp.]